MRRALVASALVWAAAPPAFLREAHGAGWPQWRGPNRDGLSPEKGWFVTWPPEKLWTASVGLGYSSVVVKGGRAYVTGHARGERGRGVDTVFCLDAATGNELWTHRYECGSSRKDKQGEYAGPRATPLLDEDAVYTVSLEGHLFCLEASSGKVRWQKDLDEYALKDVPMMYGYCSTPAVSGGTIMCYLNGACMAFDKKSGKPLWRRKGGRHMWNGSSPVIASTGGRTCVVFGEEELVAVDVEKGTKVWDYALGRSAVTTPVVSGDQMFFSTYPNRGACGVIRIGDGSPEPVWSNRQMQNYHVGNPVVLDGHLYGVDCRRTEFSTHDGRISSLKCIEFETGAVKWTEKKVGWAQLIAADGKLLIQREGGELVIVEASPEGYKELGRAKLPDGVYWAFPALSDGRIFCRSNSGGVVCLQAGKN